MDVAEIFNTLLTPEGTADPYPLYAALHELGDVLPAVDALVLVPSYESASSVLRDPGFLVPDGEYLDGIYPGWREHPSLNADSLLNLNDPAHARIRGLMSRQFTHRRVQALGPAVERLTGGLLDTMADLGADGAPVDFMQEFAFALPVTVISELIGVPESERDGLRPLARHLTATLEPIIDDAGLAAADAAAVKLADLFGDLAEQRRAHPTEDLLSALVAASDAADGRLDQGELTQNLILLLVAGFETTTNLLGNGLRIVLSNPSAGDELRRGELAPAAFVEEVLRYDSPVQFTENRRPVKAGEVGGVQVTSDDQLIPMLGAANRDPSRFVEPDRFWPQRPDGGPLSFGAGAHFCLGAALARLEGTVAFPRLLSRFPALAAAGEPERRAGLVLRGFERQPVSLS